jgi:hypothetical protein
MLSGGSVSMNDRFRRFTEYLDSLIEAYSFDWASLRFRRFVKTLSRNDIGEFKVLVEAGQPKSNQLALSLFLPVLMKRLNATPVFYGTGRPGVTAKIKAILRQYFSVINTLGRSPFLYIAVEKNSQKGIIESSKNELILRIQSPEQLELFTYRGVLIGDLIYDTYLRETNHPTINLDDDRYKELINKAMELVDFWIEYLQEEKVVAICVSHTVYLHAIPARVGVLLEREVFQVNLNAIYRVTRDFPFAYTDFRKYKEQFKQISQEAQTAGLVSSKVRLEKRFNGEIGVDMSYSSKSAFTINNFKKDTGIKGNEKIKILVAVHDFFDSPHSFGDNFYPDFYLWIQRLSELALRTDYDWYIKTHPDVTGAGIMAIEDIVSSSNCFKVIAADTSHHDLIRDGINFVLTVYGTVGMEYPALGVPAINASLNNPHAAYGFSITPKSRREYEAVILNLGHWMNYSINLDEIYEYYFIHHVYNLKDWIFVDHEEMLMEVGGYKASNNSKIYKYFLDSENKRTLNDYRTAIDAFLNSNDTRIRREHFGCR